MHVHAWKFSLFMSTTDQSLSISQSVVLLSNVLWAATHEAMPLQDATEAERLQRLIKILSVSLSLRLAISLNEAANKSRASLQLHCMWGTGARERETERDRKVLIMHTQQYSTVAQRHRAWEGRREKEREKGRERFGENSAVLLQ